MVVTRSGVHVICLYHGAFALQRPHTYPRFEGSSKLTGYILASEPLQEWNPSLMEGGVAPCIFLEFLSPALHRLQFLKCIMLTPCKPGLTSAHRSHLYYNVVLRGSSTGEVNPWCECLKVCMLHAQ